MRTLPLHWQIPLVAVAYFVMGRIGLLLAIPPGYASPLWPPAGLALAALLLWGPRCWPGVLLGSFGVNLTIGLNTNGLPQMVESTAVAFLIGAGAAAQAIGSRWLILRVTQPPWRFDHPRQIFAVNLLGGLVGCSINATLGNIVLLAFGLQELHSIAYAWFNWWVGDTIGVFFFTSLLLLIATPSPYITGLRKNWVAIPMLLMFLLVMLLFVTTQKYERNRILEHLGNESDDIMHELSGQIDTVLGVLASLQRFHNASESVTREEFASFTAGILATTPSIAALEWIPEVPLERRETIEAQLQAEGFPHFRFTEIGAGGELVTASQRPLYYPVILVEPLQRNLKALGLDLGSHPARLDAIRRAQASGQFAASTALQLVQDNGSSPAVLIFEPLQHHVSGERSLMLEIVRFSALVDTVMPTAHRKAISFTIMDQDMQQVLMNQSGETGHAEPLVEPRGTRVVHDLKIADQSWKVIFPLDKRYLDHNSTWYVWMVLTGGVLFSSLLGNLLMIITGQQDATARMVDQRTLELQQQKNELERIRNELLQANQHKNLFLANMSHELRTPLNAIIGFSRRLLKSAPDRLNEREREGLYAALRNGKMLLNLINDLLDLSRIEAGELDIQETEVPVQELLTNLCRNLEDDCTDKGLALITRFHQRPLVLQTDPVRLTQILSNLLVNAIKYTDQGSVTVELVKLHEKNREYCRINIIDTGNGIPDDIRNSLFVAYTRAKEVQLKTIEGSGLGLSIAALLTARLGGTIGVESSPGHGSTFHVQFPLHSNTPDPDDA
ncbi:MAG: hypothetical protein HPY82_20610 [Gammaproteobacteria bacterium]|nr:hypothetical protein [Gammaproteobacteria bacterium]